MEKLPSGKYWIGDLCYVMENEWDEVCGLMFPDNFPEGVQGIFTLKDGRKFAAFRTAYGDGRYYDREGNEYGVDAGLIGCILVDDIDKSDPDNVRGIEELGHIHTMSKPFIPYITTLGPRGWYKEHTIHYGHVHIDTAMEEDEEDEEETDND